MRVLVPVLFVLIGLSLLLQFLWFVFVVHFEEVVASVVISFVLLFVFKLFAKGR